MKILRKKLSAIIAAVLLVGGLSFMPVVDAQKVTYTGIGEYRMGEGESTEMARERAKEYAERNAIEQAGVMVESETRVINHVFEADEIRTITMGILRVVGQPVYTPLIDGNGFMMKAELKAEIETNDIAKWFNRDKQERDALVSQNNALIKSGKEQEQRIGYLQNRLISAKSEQEKERIRIEVEAADNTFLSVQKAKEGWQFYYNGDYNNALVSFASATNLCNQNAEAYKGRGLTWEKLQNFDEARKYYTQSISIDPSDPVPYNNRGNIYRMQKKYQQAIADFNQAMAIDSQYAPAYNGRGFVYYDMGNYQQAIDDYTRAIGINPKLTQAYNNRGVAYDFLGNRQQAMSDYTQAIAIDPNNSDAYYNRALVYAKQENYQQAISDYTKVISMTPKFGKAYYCRGVCYLNSGDKVKAYADFAVAESLGYKHRQ